MFDWRQLASLINFCAAYYTTQLVRCAAFSFVLIGLVMLLRKMLFSRRTFIRGLLWSSFLLIPFLGKLKMFYENGAVLRMTWRVTHGTMTCLWADRIYMAGVFIAAICIFGKRFCLRKSVGGMEKVSLDNTVVSVTDINVTPFTVGLLKTLKLLRSGTEGAPPAVTYAGEREFEDMKRRMGEIASFRPYRKKLCMGMAAAAVLVIAALLLAVHTHSYAQSNESNDIMVGNYDGETQIISHDTQALSQMISYDDRYVYVEREAFEAFLEKKVQTGRYGLFLEDFINCLVWPVQRNPVFMKVVQKTG